MQRGGEADAAVGAEPGPLLVRAADGHVLQDSLEKIEQLWISRKSRFRRFDAKQAAVVALIRLQLHFEGGGESGASRGSMEGKE